MVYALKHEEMRRNVKDRRSICAFKQAYTRKRRWRGGGTSNYNSLANKPVVNGVTLIGNLSLEDLGIEEISNTEIEQIINSIGGL